MTKVSRILQPPLFFGLLLVLLMSMPGIVNASPARPSSTVRPDLNCVGAPPCTFLDKRVSPASHKVNETPIASDPHNALHLLVGGNDYSCPNEGGGTPGVRFESSINGGNAFPAARQTCLNGDANGRSAQGDPSGGWDLNGCSYITGTENKSTGSDYQITIEQSCNNGLNWSAAVDAVAPYYPGGVVAGGWLQIDDTAASPHANCLYISAYQTDGNKSNITVSHYCGAWPPAFATVAVDTDQVSPTIDGGLSHLAIEKNGDIYVAWQRCTFVGGTCGGQPSTEYIAESIDGGMTWGQPVTIATVTNAPQSCGGAGFGCLPGTNVLVNDYPSIDVDRSNGCVNPCNVYAVFYNWTGTFMQVEVATAINDVWGAPMAVTSGTLLWDQFFPWLSVNSLTGAVGVSWMDRRNGSGLSYEEFGAFSCNGVFPAANFQLAIALSNPNNDGFGGTFLGDYTGNTWAGKRNLYAAWTDTRNNHDQEWMGGIKTNC